MRYEVLGKDSLTYSPRYPRTRRVTSLVGLSTKLADCCGQSPAPAQAQLSHRTLKHNHQGRDRTRSMDRQTRARKGWDAQERRRGQAASNKSHHKHVPTCGHATEHCYTRRHSYHETPFSPTTRHKEYIPARHNPAQAVGVHRVGCARVGARARARGSSDERRDHRPRSRPSDRFPTEGW